MRFFLPIPLALALLAVGCATPQQQAERAEAKKNQDNSRLTEQRRVLAAENGEAGSKRGAEVLIIDPEKKFDPSRSAVGGRTYNAGKAQTKDFYFAQKAQAGTYRAGDFYGSKKAWAGDMKFSAQDANTRGKYGIPNATKDADTKTAATKEAWDAGKTAPSRGLADGQREFRGPERAKLGKSIDPATMGDWRNSGRESVVNSGNSVEKYSTMKSLTIEDIRELLNKNK